MGVPFTKEQLSYLIALQLKSNSRSQSRNPNLTNPDCHPIDRMPLGTARRSSPETAATSWDSFVLDGDKNIDNFEEANSPKPDWVITISKKLKKAGREHVAGAWGKLSIYRVPRYLRGRDDKAYIPQTVSLGPYHHGKKHLRNMEPHKWRALNQILNRTGQNIKLYLDSIKVIQKKAAACYEGQIHLGNEFVEMMVLDGCFILELFRGVYGGFKQLGYSRNDPVFAMNNLMHLIRRDMIMLENQLPLFVLVRLFRLQHRLPPDQRGTVVELAIRFFVPLIRPTDKIGHVTSFDPLKFSGPLRSLHCLDVFRRSFLWAGLNQECIKQSSDSDQVADYRTPGLNQECIKQSSDSDQVADYCTPGLNQECIKRSSDSDKATYHTHQLIRCVTELSNSGIKFEGTTGPFWDMEFKNGVLKIPKLRINGGTKLLFLNLIAFEQRHLDCSNEVITPYAIFMDNLINSHTDVAYLRLHDHKIIEHWLGSDAEVADLFNRLCEGVVFDINHSYLSKLTKEVDEYCEYRWHRWRASLKHNYFYNPWASISVIAAGVLLLLTFSQSFYGIYGYYRPR